MHYFKWKYIAILTQEEDIFTLVRIIINYIETVSKFGIDIVEIDYSSSCIIY